MKKKLLTILVTSIIMIVGMGVFLWRMSTISRKMNADRKALLQEEKDLGGGKKALKDIEELELKTLYVSGKRKNVITREYKGIAAIYDTAGSASTREMLTDIQEKGEYTAKEPLWAYNPFGTNPESLYLYFESEGKCYCRYTISVDDEEIPDFTRTLYNGDSGNVTSQHEYQLTGLVPGRTNYIILRLYNSKDKLSQTLYYRVDMPESYSGAEVILKSESGRSKEELQNGLYVVFSDRKKKNAILLYDNCGVLRGEFPVETTGYNAEFIYDNLVYSITSNQFAQVNGLGQVTGVLKMSSYKQCGEFAYDGSGSIYVLADKASTKEKAGCVVKLSVTGGEVTEALDMKNIGKLKPVYNASKKKKDWIGLDSIQVVGVNQLLLGSSRYSSIFKVSNVGSLLPKLDYIIADEDLWKDYKKLKKKVLMKTLAEGETAPPEETPVVDSILDTGTVKQPDVFDSQYGQNAMVIDTTSKGLSQGQYYLYMLNNNSGIGASKNNKSSYYYRYLVDENAGTYLLADQDRLEKNKSGGNVTPYGETYLYCKSGIKTYEECDTRGKLLKSFEVEDVLKRVYKQDWKGFWFH